MSEPSPSETIGYSAAAAELENILEEIESGSADVDVLTQRVERAAFLIKLCREKLAGTEMKVTKILEGIESDRDGSADGAGGADRKPD